MSWKWGSGGTTLVLAMGIALGCETLPGDPPPGAESQPGFAAYTKYCARCHGQDGTSERSSRIAKKPISLVDPRWKAGTRPEEIEHVIRYGDGKMEGLEGKLTEQEVQQIVEYVLWLPEPAAP